MTVGAVVTNIVSSRTIPAMPLDRLLAVSSPHQYIARVTKAKIRAFIAVVWIYAFLFFKSWMDGSIRVTVVVVLYCHFHVSVHNNQV